MNERVPMKRLVAAGAAALAVFAVSGCGAVPESGVAATIGDSEVSVDQLESLMRDVTSLEGSGVVADPDTDTVDGAFARQVMSLLVTNTATEEFLAANGESITDADRQPVLDGIASTDPSREFPDVLDLLVDFQARETAVARVAPDAGDLQARYEASPGDLGVLCVRHVLVATEAEAEDVLDELAGGADIADVATERSTDPAAATNGGAIEITQGQGCTTVAAAREAGLVGPFVDAALTAVPGTPVGPVETDFGWHVIEARPYDEIADSLTAIAGQLAFSSFLTDLDVSVSPRYGRWDPATGAVVAL